MIADAIKVKVLSLVSVVAVTVMLLCGYTAHNQASIIQGKTDELASLNTLMEVQRETIKSLTEDLEKKPKEYIKIVKDIDRKLCEGIGIGNSILSLPSAKKVNGELVHEINTKNNDIDIDSKLPADLIRLLD